MPISFSQKDLQLISLVRRKSHVFSLALVTLVVIAIGTLSTLDWNEYNQNAAVARHARAIGESAQRLLSALDDTEVANLGYLLTGDLEYLVPIEAGRAEIERSLNELEQPGVGLDDAATVSKIRNIVTDQLQDIQHTIALRRAGDAAGAEAYLAAHENRQKLADVSSTIYGIISDQYKLFAARALLARQHAARTRLSVLFGTGLLAILLLAANVHVHRLVGAQGRLIAELETARDQEEKAKNTFETTLESIGDAVISIDAKSRVQFMNSAAEKLTRWPRTAAAGASLAEVFPVVDEESGQTVEDSAGTAMARGAAVSPQRHSLLLTKGGNRLPIDESAAPLRNRQGETAGAVLVFRDVSPQREAQRQLQDSEQRYRLLFESNPQPMWVFEVSTLKFLEVNQSAILHYGYSREEFLNMTIRDIRPPEDVAKLVNDIDKPNLARHTDGPWRHRKKDGTIIYVEITAHPIVFEGRDARFILAHDITQRAQLEEQLRQAQKLEAVGRLAGGVAHDFNNMLTVISGYTEFLAESFAENEEARPAIAEIGGAAQRATNLTKQLLAFSRHQVLQPQVLNLNKSVTNIQKMLGRLLGEDIDLRIFLEPGLWNVSADPGQIDQILMNLAINARDAMEKGGTLTIETSNTTLDEQYDATHVGVVAGDYVRLSITDTGFGMDATTKARLFEPFFTTKEVGRGTGLGLSTVYGIVKQSRGNIWVYSEPGKGTVFSVYLPRSGDSTTPSQAPATVEPVGDTGLSILVVEDDPNVCKLVSAMLASKGYSVMNADSLDEAVRHSSSSHRIDLLLCDMVLPQNDGPTIAKAVLERRPGLPVIFMSGYTEHAVLRQEQNTPFLQKPFTRDALANKIRTVLHPNGNGA